MFSWKIEALFVVPQDSTYTDVVVKVIWKCFASADGTYDTAQCAACYGHMMFVLGNSFTEFKNLTEEQILNWCFANGVNKTEIETIVSNSLKNKPSSSVESRPLPWVNG